MIHDRYRLEKPLAQGGMGIVWLARHLLLDVPIAIKFVAPRIAKEHDALRRFEREAKAAAALRSPHVVQILDYGIEGDVPYLVMELLSGETLEDRLARAGRLDLVTAAKILTQACKAVELATDARIIHRDLKPLNLFLARCGREEIVKILDFGAAKGPWIGTGETTQNGRMVGSVPYMSPEQARGNSRIDHRSDLWSLAVILYRMIVGERPFEGPELGDLILKICFEPLPRPTVLRAELPPELDRYFAKAFARDPDARFQSASEMAALFRSVVAEATGVADFDAPILLSADPEPEPTRDAALRSDPTTLGDTMSGRPADGPDRRPPRLSAPPAGRVSEMTTLESGQIVGERFEIIGVARQGGMGAVYRARDVHTGEPVALKMLLVDRMEHASRFLQEARLLAELNHPAIVRHIAHGRTAAGGLYLAMEWLEGEDLAKRLRRGRLGIAESIDLIARVANALAPLHARGIVHRDIKPSNLFLRDGDPRQVTVLDFGVAHLTDAVRQTRTGVSVGTPGYMAPEQAGGRRDIDARADVFALGAVLYECLAGVPAFAADHALAVLAKILVEDTPRLREVRPELPESLDELLGQMLQKDRAARPDDGLAVAEALSRLDLEVNQARRNVLTANEERVISIVLVGSSAEGPSGVPVVEDEGRSSPDQGVSPELRAAFDAHGGRVHALGDGSVAAIFAAHGAGADPANRAARCALEGCAGAPSPVVVATGRRGGAGRPGGAIDRAVRLLADARPGFVRVCDVTARLVAAKFRILETTNRLEVADEDDGVGSIGTLLDRSTPFVGREAQLGAIEAAFAASIEEPSARAIVVKGRAGAGKSRLAAEFLAEARNRNGVQILTAAGDSRRTGAAYGLVRHAIQRAAGIERTEPISRSREQLRDRVARRAAAGDVDRITEFLGEVALPRAQEDASAFSHALRPNAIEMEEQIRFAFDDWLLAETGAGPVVIVVEDLQWADPASVKLIDGALRTLADRPLFVLALFRSEAADVFPELWADRQQINLGPLGRAAAERLIGVALPSPVDPAVMQRIVDLADGNPFCLEELVRAVAAGRADALPQTVLAMVQARLSALDPKARRILRAASVFGHVFRKDAVAALVGHEDLDRWLANSEVFHARGGDTFEFRQTSVREAAYAMLTDEDRALGHRLAAEWLIAVGDADPVTVAEHFVRGCAPERAVEWFNKAEEDDPDVRSTER